MSLALPRPRLFAQPRPALVTANVNSAASNNTLRPVGNALAPASRGGSRSSSSSRLRLPPSRRLLLAAPPSAQKQSFKSFDDMVANSELPLLVDFYATWCGPCQMAVPVLSSIQAKLEGRLKVVKIDTEKYPNIASRYQIQALPTLMLFKNGAPVDKMEGLPSEAQIMERIEAMLRQK